VVFLDPFGLNVNWATLEAIRRTTVLDVWYLFSLCGLYRNVPLSFAKLTPDKIAAVARALGELDWPDRFYAALQPATSAGPDLFSVVAPPRGKSRFLDVNAMEAYVMRRLGERDLRARIAAETAYLERHPTATKVDTQEAVAVSPAAMLSASPAVVARDHPKWSQWCRASSLARAANGDIGHSAALRDCPRLRHDDENRTRVARADRGIQAPADRDVGQAGS
jgi:hypothetical protein